VDAAGFLPEVGGAGDEGGDFEHILEFPAAGGVEGFVEHIAGPEGDDLDGFVEVHKETGHVRIGHRQRFPFADLFDEQRDDRTARGHDVAVAGAGKNGFPFAGGPGLGNHQFFHHRLGYPHGVDRIDRLVGTQGDDLFHPAGQGSAKHVLGAEHVGTHRLHGVEFAGGDLLEGGGMEDEVYLVQGGMDAIVGAYVADVELQFGVVQIDPHVFLLLFITGKNADLLDVGIEEAPQDRVAEGTGTAGDEKCLTAEHCASNLRSSKIQNLEFKIGYS